VRRSVLPSAWCRALSEGSYILLGQLHDEVLVTRPAPSIAHNAANQPLTIAVGLDEGFLALVTNNIGHDTSHSLTAPLAVTLYLNTLAPQRHQIALVWAALPRPLLIATTMEAQDCTSIKKWREL
jgi:hypothetical protein